MKCETKMVLTTVVLAVLILAPVGQAATRIIMDANHHNGSLTSGSAGYWDETPAAIPAGWNEAVSRAYTAAGGPGGTWVQLSNPNGEFNPGTVVNNTGEVVQANEQYTLQADLSGWNPTGQFLYPATVTVYATENADGTGNKAFLVGVTRLGTYNETGYTLFTVSNTSAGFGSRYAGYYIQVALQYTGFYDNIIVTSEPQTADTLMNPTLHNGSFNGAIQGFWFNQPSAKPAGWVETVTLMYTMPWSYVSCGTWAIATNNTGELVHATQQYKISGDLGSTGVGVNAVVRVYATKNADGTGYKVLLAEVSRQGTSNDGYNLFHVDGTPGTPTGASLEGFYLQVTIGGGNAGGYYGGYYDNLTVIATPYSGPPVADTYYYMNDTFHNGLLTSQSTAGHWDFPEYIPYEWSTTREPNSVYTTTIGYELFSWNADNPGCIFNNTGEKVPANHRFTINADLGGQPGAIATASAYATQNADGSGNKVLLAQVSRAGDANGFTPLYMRYPTTGTPGSLTPSGLAGYYVRVELQTSGDPNVPGFYDNIVVSSQADPTPPDCITVATVGQTVYDMWVSVGKPNCWCYAWQCKGDADGLTEGSAKTGGVYHVGANDLNVLTSGWKKLDTDPAFAANICADFDHQTEGSAKTGGVYHVGANDLNILIVNWKSTTVAGDCGGTLVP